MKIKRHYSLEVATAVVDVVERLITNKQVAGELMVHSFSNGREQGLVIKRDWGVDNEGRQVGITQHKVSDSIVIYYGPSREFDFTTNHPENWDMRRHFAYGHDDYAARFILEYLFYEEGDGC